MAVHAHGLAGTSQVAVGPLLGEQEIQAVAHGGRELAFLVGVAGPQVGEQGQTGQRGVGLPVGALPEAGLAGGTVDGEIIVAGNGRAVLVARGAAIPAAVGVLMAGEPVERALDRLLAGRAGTALLGQGRAVRVESRAGRSGEPRSGSDRSRVP